MSKIPKILLGAFLSQLFLSNLALATSVPANFTPQKATTFFELNTSNPNPFNNQFSQWLKSTLSPQTAEDNAVFDLVKPYLDKTTLSYSETYNPTDYRQIHLTSVALPEDIFQKVLDLAKGQIKTTKLPNGLAIYETEGKSNSDNLFFTYKDGNLIAASKKGIISDLLLSTPASLSQDKNFQTFQSQSSPDSFFRMFLNFNNIPTSTTSEPAPSDMLQAEGISINQTGNGLEGKVLVFPGKKLALNTADYTFSPALYQKVNAQNLLLYTESNNYATHTSDTLKLLTQNNSEIQTSLEELTTGLSEATALAWTELSALFQKRSALIIHSDLDHQYFPAISIISEVKGHEIEARTTLNKLTGRLTKLLDSESTQYTSTTLTSNLGTFQQIKLTGEALNFSTDSAETKFDFTMDFGVTNDGLLVVSTLNNPEQLFSTTGLSADPEWKSQFNQSSVMEVSFVNFLNLHSYISSLSTTFKAPAEFTTSIDKFMAPLKSAYSENLTQDGNLLSHFKVHLDNSKLTDLISMFKDSGWMNSTSFSEPQFRPDPTDNSYFPTQFLNQSAFKDVAQDSWYEPSVKHLFEKEVMHGYGEYFKPAQSITRAEFIKTLIEAKKNLLYQDITEDLSAENFNDVPAGTWYYSYLKTARSNHYVHGYQDNTFHPNQPISRAEAIQIITNSEKEYFGLDNPAQMHKDLGKNHPFSDVRPTDWFYDAVYGAYWANVVNGKTATLFAPNDNLSRAEAAVMIDHYAGF